MTSRFEPASTTESDVGATLQADGSYRIPSWIRELAGVQQGDRALGRIAAVDSSARLRGAAEIRTGKAASLARELREVAGDESGFRIDMITRDYGEIVTARDTISLSCHGTDCTHIDGLNHFGALGRWHDGTDVASKVDEAWSIGMWATHGIVTRCWLFDVPEYRSVGWVAPESPVTGAELQSVVEAKGIEIHPGDALLIYMGRDEYERAGNVYRSAASSPDGRPGLSPSAGRWIGNTPASIVCWDFMDACGGDMGLFGVHLLIWAVGLALVDNCDLGPVRGLLRSLGRVAGCLFVSPLAIAGGTGSAVTPVVVC